MKTPLVRLLLLLTVLLAACHDHSEPERVADRTVILYFPYTGNLYSSLLGNLRGVEQSIADHGIGNNHVVAFVCRDSQSDANLIEITFDKKQGVLRDTLCHYSQPEVTTMEFIEQVLTDVQRHAPANNYGLCVGSHGEGWFQGRNGQARSRWFGGLAHQTDVETFAEALQNSRLHLEFLLFDACYMACIENVYSFRNVTDYYIASTSEVMNDGMPYADLFHYLLYREPDYQALNQAYHNFYSSYSMPYGTLSVSDCRQAEQMAALMRRINLQHDFNPELLSQLQDLDAGHHTPTVYFDFGHYVENLCTTPALLEEFQRALESLVVSKSTTERIYTDSGSPRVINVDHFSGLTISDPSTNPSATTKTETAWWKATH